MVDMAAEVSRTFRSSNSFMATKNTVSQDEWDKQADLFELGFKHASEIAAELGVSSQTVARQMKSRGAVKGARVSQSTDDLVSMLNHKAKLRALKFVTDSRHRRMVSEANTQAVGQMVAAILQADKQGDLSQVMPIIELMGKAVGAKRSR